MARHDYSDFGPPRPADGIRIRREGASGWWAKRFIGLLERSSLSSRLARGRRYARQGQVLSCEIELGRISGRVQGSKSRPYHVEITVAAHDEAAWQKIDLVLASQARFVADLLNGHLPEAVEEELDREGVSLLPTRARELRFRCSCPDKGDPCKHAAALLFVFAEKLDDNPFALFRLHGRDENELLASLRALRAAAAAESAEVTKPVEAEAVSPQLFWETPVEAAVGFDFSPGSVERDFYRHLPRVTSDEFQSLKSAYALASARARALADTGDAQPES